jgi:hypothetical protein
MTLCSESRATGLALFCVLLLLSVIIIISQHRLLRYNIKLARSSPGFNVASFYITCINVVCRDNNIHVVRELRHLVAFGDSL